MKKILSFVLAAMMVFSMAFAGMSVYADAAATPTPTPTAPVIPTEEEINAALSDVENWYAPGSTVTNWDVTTGDNGISLKDTDASGWLISTVFLPNAYTGMFLEFDIVYPEYAAGDNTFILDLHFGGTKGDGTATRNFTRIVMSKFEEGMGTARYALQSNTAGAWLNADGITGNNGAAVLVESNVVHVVAKRVFGESKFTLQMTCGNEVICDFTVDAAASEALADENYSKDVELKFQGNETAKGVSCEVTNMKYSYCGAPADIANADSWNLDEPWTLTDGVFAGGVRGTEFSLNDKITLAGLTLKFDVTFDKTVLERQTCKWRVELGDAYFHVRMKCKPLDEEDLQIEAFEFQLKKTSDSWNDALYNDPTSTYIRGQQYLLTGHTFHVELYVTQTGLIKCRAFTGSAEDGTTDYENFFLVEWTDTDRSNIEEGLTRGNVLNGLWFGVEDAAGWTLSNLYVGDCLSVPAEPEVVIPTPTPEPTPVVSEGADTTTAAPATTTQAPATTKAPAATEEEEGSNVGIIIAIVAAVVVVVAVVVVIVTKKKK